MDAHKSGAVPVQPSTETNSPEKGETTTHTHRDTLPQPESRTHTLLFPASCFLYSTRQKGTQKRTGYEQKLEEER